MHILLEHCKQTVSGKEAEEENLFMIVMGKAALFSLQSGLATQPELVFEVAQIAWCCDAALHRTIRSVTERNKCYILSWECKEIVIS